MKLQGLGEWIAKKAHPEVFHELEDTSRLLRITLNLLDSRSNSHDEYCRKIQELEEEIRERRCRIPISWTVVNPDQDLDPDPDPFPTDNVINLDRFRKAA